MDVHTCGLCFALGGGFIVIVVAQMELFLGNYQPFWLEWNIIDFDWNSSVCMKLQKEDFFCTSRTNKSAEKIKILCRVECNILTNILKIKKYVFWEIEF